MRKPNDIKRPNTHSGKLDKERKANPIWFFVSVYFYKAMPHSTVMLQSKPQTYRKERT